MLVMINRDDSSSRCWPYLVRRKTIANKTLEEVIHKYSGFEGEVISSISLSENTMLVEKFIKEYEGFFETNKTLALLIVLNKQQSLPKELDEKFTSVGYDFGTDEDHYMCSSIFNEILFGCEEKLVAFKDSLNEHFLFPNRSLTNDYVLMHHKLSNEGANVEFEYGMEIYEIWKYNDDSDASTLLERTEKYDFPHKDDSRKRNEIRDQHWKNGEHIHIGCQHVLVDN